MRILVLGGTLFLGRAVVDCALAAGHQVTLFNRGRTNPGLFPDTEQITGDRDSDLARLDGRSFDAVIDTSGYFPRQMLAAVEVLGKNIEHYTFVSSASVYADQSVPGMNEDAELARVESPDVEELGENYGGFKALCEQALEDALPGRVHNVRSGLIVGPHDNTGRFSYWVERIGRGGEVLAPEPKDQPVQVIDVRDLADWILTAAQDGVSGPFNAMGPAEPLTLASVLEEIQSVLTSDSRMDWVGEEFLTERGVEPWSDLPLWLPPTSVPAFAGFMSRDVSRAVAQGLTFRPLTDTIEATTEWLARSERIPDKDFGNRPASVGLAPERERQLLDEWAAR